MEAIVDKMNIFKKTVVFLWHFCGRVQYITPYAEGSIVYLNFSETASSSCDRY
jgi:hypothetical protein